MKEKFTVRIERAIKKALSPKTWIQAIKKAFTPKNILITIVDAVIALLILFTFWGEYLIGQNLSINYLFTAIFIYLTYAIYKFICRIQDKIDEMER